jgi:nucleoside-diphosphate-sugar epimerase
MKQTIMVTGGTGYVGSWVVKGLLENGHTVRLTVRNKNKKEKFQHLQDIANSTKGILEIWEADLLNKGSFDHAAMDCDAIAHIASPFFLNVKDAQKDLVEPAVLGTTNVLEAANKSKSVKKVVLTSSVAAIMGDSVDMLNQNLSSFNESHFNTSSTLKHQPYSYSKTQAEKKAWEIAKAQNNWELLVINPSFVMGPPMVPSPDSESVNFMMDMLNGKFKTGAAELYFGFVDVRDVAKAHIYCLENKAEGRHILAERVSDVLSFANIIGEQFGKKYKLPQKNNPKWLLALIGGLFGLSRKFVKNNIGYPIKLDSTKSKEKLHLNYIPLEQTIKDMVDQIELLKKS